MSRFLKLALFAASLALLVSPAAPGLAAPKTGTAKAAEIVSGAEKAVIALKGSPQGKSFHEAMAKAVGVLVVPDFYKGGLIVGGATGEGVLLTRPTQTAAWSQPAFFRLSSGSVGLQAGLKESELVLVVRSAEALGKLMKDKVALGVEGGLAVATVGAGMGASSTSAVDADVVVFTLSKGAFAGVSVEGSVLSASEELNKAYYGGAFTPAEIVNGRPAAHRDEVAALRNAL